MTKKDPKQSSAKQRNQQHTEVHVETHSEQHTSGGASDVQTTELMADLQRVQAEFINYKRRAEQERGEIMTAAKARVAREFLTVRDSFDQELAHRPAKMDAAWAASIDSIRAQFDAVLKNLGVERFDSLGQPFDPHRHEAIATNGDGDTVIEELQAGYQLGDTVLRHAIVRVGQPD